MAGAYETLMHDSLASLAEQKMPTVQCFVLDGILVWELALSLMASRGAQAASLMQLSVKLQPRWSSKHVEVNVCSSSD